ncbi:MAG: hypothetical protein R3F39_07495 [Myxococcota bacterium]
MTEPSEAAVRYASRRAALAAVGVFLMLALFSNVYYPVQRLALFGRPAPGDASVVSGVDAQGGAVFLRAVDRFCCPDLTRESWDAGCGHGLANAVVESAQWEHLQTHVGACDDGRELRLVRLTTVLDAAGAQTASCPIATCRAAW